MGRAKKKLIVVVPMPGIFLLDIAGPSDVFAQPPSDYRRTFRTSLHTMEE